jgi:hypothetical protein
MVSVSATRTAEALISYGQEGQGDGLSNDKSPRREASGGVTTKDRLTMKRKDGGVRNYSLMKVRRNGI